ncbi:hypothetical protein HMF7854_12690 [Sphingomonas ginkgonis]|uniref:Uncharacterized protein n=1 Tax=Sphingomonas ginkgonis TaxID=2315330 RepID=A0A3R9WTP8_9SPHN|nr:hypothetical protein [Sphingomonas ginkgonis]RST31597.1 hypothetical protein HMF7854_12690 [Sphingomonas ginkgonis]
MQILDRLIRAETPARTDKLYFSPGSLPETLFYGAMAAKMKKEAVMLDGSLAEAHWLRGFALVDLDRSDAAKGDLDRAVQLAPLNSRYLAERGEWYKNRRDWERSYADFDQAVTAAGLSSGERTGRDKARALRGMAFARVEQDRLDDARKLLNQALAADPGNERTKADLADLAARKKR